MRVSSPPRAVALLAAPTAVLALALAAIALDPPPARAASCGRVDVGFTNARLTTSRVSCTNARAVVRSWRRAGGRRCSQGVCDVTARGYRCRGGGTAGLIRIRCADGRRVVRFSYGD